MVEGTHPLRFPIFACLENGPEKRPSADSEVFNQLNCKLIINSLLHVNKDEDLNLRTCKQEYLVFLLCLSLYVQYGICCNVYWKCIFLS